MSQTESWWSATCHSALLDGVQLVEEWERDLLEIVASGPEEHARSRAVQSLGDLTKTLWHKFNNQRKDLDRDYMSDEKMLAAYLSAFFVPNIERTRFIARSQRVEKVLQKFIANDTLEILDFGSGPLSSTIGLLIALGEIASNCEFKNNIKQINITATERSDRAVKIAKKWLEKSVTNRCSIQIERQTSIPQNKQFDIVIASNVLNEIPEKHQLKTLLLLKNTLKKQNKDGSIFLIIEPGQEIHSKRLITLRDELLASNQMTDCKIIAPCPHESSCPLSPKEEKPDWCWFRCRFKVPRLQSELDKKNQLDHSELAFSFIALSTQSIKSAPWAICVSDEMSVGDSANHSRRYEYFAKNSVFTPKTSQQKLLELAKSGFKTKLCSSNGKLIAGVRNVKAPENRLQRGDELDDASPFDLIISER